MTFPPVQDYFDLRDNPRGIERIPAARQYLPLRNFLAAVNSADSVFISGSARAQPHSPPPGSSDEASDFSSQTRLVFADSSLNFERDRYAELAARLRDEGVETVETARAPRGLIVKTRRPNLLALGSFRAGLFEVQDKGSQLIATLCKARPGETVLDACAGAGGKTLAIAADLRGEGRLVACDPDAERLQRLALRAQRAGARIEIGTRPLAGLHADVVLVDAPCSELGILRRGPDARFRIEEDHLGAFPRLQREILEQTLPCVRSGGRLVYATCTIRCEENEEVARSFERDHPELARDVAGIESPDGFFRTFPHREGTDAFFAARWTVSRGSDAAR